MGVDCFLICEMIVFLSLEFEMVKCLIIFELLNIKRSRWKNNIMIVYCSLREVGCFCWIYIVLFSDICGCFNLIIRDFFISFYCNSYICESSVVGSISRDDFIGFKVEVVLILYFWVNVYNIVFFICFYVVGFLRKK